MPPPRELKSFSAEEIAKHDKLGDLWIVIDNHVYDVSKFGKLHPGGNHILLNVAGAGKDATEAFFAFHKTEVLDKYYPKLCIGTVEGGKKSEIYVHPSARTEKIDIKTAPMEQLLKHPLLSKAPFGESAAIKKYYDVPYYKVSHLRLRLALREFFCSIREVAEDSEENNDYPTAELFKRMGAEGILASKVGVMAMPYAKKFNIPLPGGVSPDEFDFFHELIAHEETGRLGCPGYVDGLFAGFAIGLPPLINFYQGKDKDQIVKEILTGEKRVCLAITGPEAGSDVANHTTVATLSADKSHWVVRGLKKWITCGCFCDYFVTAVRTGGKGVKGISLVLCKREDGISTKQLSCSYSKAAATALVLYEDAKVPVDRILGKLNGGFLCIMLNFNHERWMIAACILGNLRLVLQECILWLNQRKAFGKSLTEQPVLRFKLGEMIAGLEALQGYMDHVTHNMDVYYKRVAADAKTWQARDYLAGEIGLLKYQTTRTAHLFSDNGCQLFGGRAVTRTGMGKYMERLNRCYKIYSIYGGSEEIMADLGVRQGLREWSKADRVVAKL